MQFGCCTRSLWDIDQQRLQRRSKTSKLTSCNWVNRVRINSLGGDQRAEQEDGNSEELHDNAVERNALSVSEFGKAIKYV